jgi:hypothetical protein
MPFIVKIPGHPELDELDMTLDELDFLETDSGVSWLLASPFKSAKVAKSYLKIAYRRYGMDLEPLDSITQRDIIGWFEYRQDEGAAASATPTRARKGRKRSASSGPSPDGSTGPPPSPGSNVSGTS